jgi:hypothetical protein
LEKKIKKKYIQDCIVTFASAAILWLIQIYVVITVAGIVPDPTAKAVIIFVGIAATVIATTAAAAVVIHLKKNKAKIYTEELEVTEKQTNIFMMVFDTFFILVLCFATLLTAMLMKGDSMGGLNYHVNYLTFGIMVIALLIYIFLLLVNSEKGLRNMIETIYVDHENQE